MINPFLHLFILIVLVALARNNLKLLCLTIFYGMQWQLNEYVSVQESSSALIQIFFLTTCTAITLHLTMMLAASWPAGMFALLQLFALSVYFMVWMLNITISSSAFNSALQSFNNLNIALQWFDLVALIGIVNGLGGARRNTQQSSDANLYSAVGIYSNQSAGELVEKQASYKRR